MKQLKNTNISIQPSKNKSGKKGYESLKSNHKAEKPKLVTHNSAKNLFNEVNMPVVTEADLSDFQNEKSKISVQMNLQDYMQYLNNHTLSVQGNSI